jgi:hypothetical protein
MTDSGVTIIVAHNGAGRPVDCANPSIVHHRSLIVNGIKESP